MLAAGLRVIWFPPITCLHVLLTRSPECGLSQSSNDISNRAMTHQRRTRRCIYSPARTGSGSFRLYLNFSLLCSNKARSKKNPVVASSLLAESCAASYCLSLINKTYWTMIWTQKLCCGISPKAVNLSLNQGLPTMCSLGWQHGRTGQGLDKCSC